MKFDVTGIEKVRDVVEADDLEMASKRFKAKYPAVFKIELVEELLKNSKGEYQKPFPDFVRYESGSTVLRKSDIDTNWDNPLPPGTAYYWKDAGAWGVRVKVTDGKLVVCEEDLDNHLAHMNGEVLIEATRKEWQEDNRGYIGREELPDDTLSDESGMPF